MLIGDHSISDSFYFNLPMVKHSPYKTHIRVSWYGQRIDLFSIDDIVFKGTLVNEITEYKVIQGDRWDSTEPYQIRYQVLEIDSVTSTVLASFILHSGQDSFQTDSLIPEWNRRTLHCWNVDFQFKFGEKYVEQSYICPWAQEETIKIKGIIVGNYEALNKILSLESLYEKFVNQLPRVNSHSRDGYMFYAREINKFKLSGKKH